MPPDYTKEGVPYSSTYGTQDTVVNCIIENYEIVDEINEALDRGSKIQAIKVLYNYYHEDNNKNSMGLRHAKDLIDVYAKRYNLIKKFQLLLQRLESWGEVNGYDKYNHKTINKSKDGIVTYSYNHWEYVDDMLNHLLNDEKWWPQPTVLKDFNEMWKEYK
tara:strand:+ start:376 stop:858 length:483 start_codon:yes stop_codon:yes gene_type:complete